MVSMANGNNGLHGKTLCILDCKFVNSFKRPFLVRRVSRNFGEFVNSSKRPRIEKKMHQKE